MYKEKMILCGANSYEKKYYLNPDFEMLPDEIKKELQIMCVLFTEETGGVLTLLFEEDGTLFFEVTVADNDFVFDEIGSQLQIKQLQKSKEELLSSLQLFYKVFVLEEDLSCS